MIALPAAVAAVGIVLPHALRLQQVRPVTAVVLWVSSLALRALNSVLAVILLLFFLPRTGLFNAVTHWCLEVAWPLIRGGVHIEGHGVADLALFVPGIALAASLLFMCHRTARNARQARHLLAHDVLGNGPGGSLIVGGPDVLFAVAGLLHPRIVVSAGALTCLDDDELEAALNHERAHIVRRHRFIVLFAVAFAAHRALRELAFHLERDADRWALRQRNDRLALASVICKAATAAPPATPAFASLGSSGVRERLSQLLDDHPEGHHGPIAAALNALATAMVIGTLLLTAMVPAAAVAGVGDDPHRGHHAHHCRH
jgi:Zn-dependent protease with chaperone function